MKNLSQKLNTAYILGICMNQSKMVVYLQDNKFMGFVEPKGAEMIKADARAYGCPVEENGEECWFNVVYTAVKKVASK